MCIIGKEEEEVQSAILATAWLLVRHYRLPVPHWRGRKHGHDMANKKPSCR